MKTPPCTPTGALGETPTIGAVSLLLRAVTGINVVQFDQGGTPYGVTLRGYSNGDHGHDIGYVVDGVPLNLIGENSGINGDANLNPLIPELVDRVILTWAIRRARRPLRASRFLEYYHA